MWTSSYNIIILLPYHAYYNIANVCLLWILYFPCKQYGERGEECTDNCTMSNE